MRRAAPRTPGRRFTLLLAACAGALCLWPAFSPEPHAAAGEPPDGHVRELARAAGEHAVVAALRANGARILALGERGGLAGHFVEPAGGGAYGLYLTADGHAVAGLLYGPDGALLTGRQIEAARGSGVAVETHEAEGAPRSGPNGEAPASGGVSGESFGADAGVLRLAHGYVERPAGSFAEALFARSASAFGFALGHTGPQAVMFADPGCPWSREAAVRLGRLALDGRLRLRVVPVGVLGAASAQEAAAIASARDPALAWFEGPQRPASAEGARRIERNNALFDAWGADAVPLTAWRTAEGRVAHGIGDIGDIDAWLEALSDE